MRDGTMSVDEVTRAFLNGVGRWAGCAWPTRFGATGLDLHGLTAAQALLLARATAGAEAADWRAAVAWLAEVEAHARRAEEAAGRAVRSAADGRWAAAEAEARLACELEGRYRSPLVWRPLSEAITASLAPFSRELHASALERSPDARG
jgi:hypothetical protein